MEAPPYVTIAFEVAQTNDEDKGDVIERTMDITGVRVVGNIVGHVSQDELAHLLEHVAELLRTGQGVEGIVAPPQSMN